MQGEAVEPSRVRYTYYTAGSGGVGQTILETSFLLAGTDVVVYSNGEKVCASLYLHSVPLGVDSPEEESLCRYHIKILLQ